MSVNIFGDQEESAKDDYDLFIGNYVYFFGFDQGDEKSVYAITQVD